MATKTTLRLDETLIKEAKRKALEQDKTLQEIVGEALASYMFGKGKIFNRTNLYKNYLDSKFEPIKPTYRSPLLEMAKQATGKEKGKKKNYAAEINEYLYGRE